MSHITLTQNFETVQQNINLSIHKEHAGIFTRFLAWCESQEDSKLLWLAITFLGNIGMVLPFTLLAILFASGNNFVLWIIALICNIPALALNLAAQPTKVTLPVLFFAFLVNAILVAYSLGVYFIS